MPFAQAVLTMDKALIAQHAVSYYAFSNDGDSLEIFMCAFHTADSSADLRTIVRTYNPNLNLKWFEEDELNTAAYLYK